MWVLKVLRLKLLDQVMTSIKGWVPDKERGKGAWDEGGGRGAGKGSWLGLPTSPEESYTAPSYIIQFYAR